MKVRFSREGMLEALALLRPAVSKTSLLPVLSNVLFDAEDGLTLTATNLSLRLQTAVDGAAVEQPGAVTLPHQMLVDVLNQMVADEIDLEADVDTARVTLHDEDAEVVLFGIPVEEFTTSPFKPTEEMTTITFEAGWLKRHLNAVMFSAATDDARPVLATVRWAVEDYRLTLVATDGFRLAKVEADLSAKDMEVLLPAEALSAALPVIERGSGPVEMTLNCNVVRFSSPTAVAELQMTDGDYPQFTNVLAEGYKWQLSASKRSMLNAFRLAGAITKHADKTRSVRIEPKDDSERTVLELTAAVKSVGENASVFPVEVVAGEGLPEERGLNNEYVLDALAHCPSDTVIIGLNSPKEPVTFLSDDEAWLCIVMPLVLTK